jgi:peptidoglycan/LPS O-acetylase OafA/YrhL
LYIITLQKIKKNRSPYLATVATILVYSVLAWFVSFNSDLADSDFSTVVRCAPYFLGIAFYYLNDHIKLSDGIKTVFKASLVVLLFTVCYLRIIFSIGLEGGRKKRNRNFAILYGLCMSFFMWGCVQSEKGRLTKLSNIYIMKHLNKASLSLYLVHTIVLTALAAYLPYYYYAFPANNFGYLFDLACVFTASISLSALAYHYIEEPCCKYGEKLLEYLKKPTAYTSGVGTEAGL